MSSNEAFYQLTQAAQCVNHAVEAKRRGSHRSAREYVARAAKMATEATRLLNEIHAQLEAQPLVAAVDHQEVLQTQEMV